MNTFKKFLKTVVNTRRFNVLGRRYQVKKKLRIFYKHNGKTMVH